MGATAHIISRCGTNIEATSLAKEIWSFEQSRGNFLVGQTPVGLPSSFSFLLLLFLPPSFIYLFVCLCIYLFFVAEIPLGDYGDQGLGWILVGM